MRAFIPLASLLLTLPGVALAQDHHRDHPGGGGGEHHGGPPPGASGDHHGGPPPGAGGEHRGPPAGAGEHRGGWSGGPGEHPGGNFAGRGGPGMAGDRPHGPDGRGGQPGLDGRGRAGDHPAWQNHDRPDRGYGGAPDRFGQGGNRAGWRPNHQGWQGGRPAGFRPVRVRPFVYPHGYSYRRWSVGLLLPRLFYGSSYYYNDWSGLGAYPPPPGDRWVRYGPDLLLVNLYTGRIDDAIYSAFVW